MATNGFSAAWSRSWSATEAPSRQNSSVMAGPMKWLTLVMRATLPVSFMAPSLLGASWPRKAVVT